MSETVRCILVVFWAVILVTSLPDDVSAVAIPSVERPSYCRSNSDMFVNCYECGRQANNKRIYELCCQRVTLINEYCRAMLA